MKNSSRSLDERLSAEEVLAVFQDRYRFQEHFGPEVEAGMTFSLDTSVNTWRSACDLLPARPLGQALNAIFGIQCSDNDWEMVLADKNTLGNVCSFISDSGACRARCYPLKIAGNDCDEAGVFVALRSMFGEAGIPAGELRPSSELAPLLEEHCGTIVDVLAKLAPGALPIPKSIFSERYGRRMRIVSMSSFALLGLTYIFARDFAFIAACALFTGNFALLGLCGMHIRKRFASDLYFEGIRTMGDLTRLIVEYRKLCH